MSEDDNEMKVRAAAQGIKFSEFDEIQPDATKKLQMVGLRDDKNVRADLTTDLVSTNSSVVFRDSKGRYKSRADMPELSNQLEVNRFLWEQIEKLLEEPEAPKPPEAPEDRLPIFAEEEPTEYPYAEDGESTDLVADDQWYQVTDPTFDYDNPDPEGLDLFIWTEMEDGTFEWVLFEEEVPDGVVIIKGEAPDKEEDGVGNGSLWFDNSEDVMQLFVWHEDSDAWISVAPPTTLEGRVATGEATQAAIIAQIQESLVEQANLSKRIDELAITKGSVARYVVTGTSVNVATRNGELYVSSPIAADVEYISFAPFDSNGQATKPCNPDDIVEFVEAAGGKYAGDITRYKVVSGDSNALTVEYLSGDNDFEVGEAEEIYVYPQNSDLASVEYVDAQDAKKLDLTGGTGSKMQGNLYMGGNFIAGVGEPTADDHAATMSYADQKLPKTGGTLTGGLNINKGDKPSPQLRITPNSGDNYDTNIYAMQNGELRFRSSGTDSENDHVGSHIVIEANDDQPTTKIYHVPEPTQPRMAASKEYVDNQVASGGAGGLTLDIWKYKGWNYDKTRLQDGEWCFTDFQDYTEIYLAQKNSRGQYYHPTSSNSTSEYTYQVTNSGGIGLPMTVMDKAGKNQFFAEPKKFVFNKGNTNYTMIECVKVRKPSAQLTADTDFMLNIPGLIGPVAGW